eukprot:c1582_g1_i1.p2 GENE.c1582_g1_i1~~c1582_g1_i1.p2  ORF type:complete len:143 (+),score=19.52 c1582_g1_i1:126-554(+)
MGSLMESPEAVVVYRQQLPKLAERYGLFSIHFQLLSNADFLEIVEEVARACRIGVGPFHGPAAKAIYLEMINAVKDVGEPSDESATLISMFCFKWQAAGVPYASRFDAIGLSGTSTSQPSRIWSALTLLYTLLVSCVLFECV